MNKHVLYVPETMADAARRIAIDLAGGATLSPGHLGYWRDSNGEIVEDAITLTTVFEDGFTARDEIARMMFAHGEQAVAYETNGVPHLIDAPLEV